MSHALQVYLDDGDYKELLAWAKARGWTLSQAVRVGLRALTRPTETDPLLAASGMIDALPYDLSQRVDSYLQNTFVAEPPSTYGQPQRKRRGRKTVRR
jgi:hypothetical protein